jgi:hypothetical protein
MVFRNPFPVRFRPGQAGMMMRVIRLLHGAWYPGPIFRAFCWYGEQNGKQANSTVPAPARAHGLDQTVFGR